MRGLALIAIFAAALLMAAPAVAVETRCGLSTGLAAGLGYPYDEELHNEFDYLWLVEANVKYYLFWGVSIAGNTGFHYAQGRPESYYQQGEWHQFDNRGASFWHASPNYGTLRVEFWRKGLFNPYIGGGGGMYYLVLWRKGYIYYKKKSNGHDEWMPMYFGEAGFDIALSKYVALRFDGKYRVQKPKNPFFGDLDFGGYDFLFGVNVYF